MGKKTQILFNFSILFLVLYYVVANCEAGFMRNCIGLFVVFLLLIYILALFHNIRFSAKLLKAVLWINFTYVLLEIATYFLLCFGLLRPDMRYFFRGLEATDKPLVRYDTIAGYKPITGEHRYISITNGIAEIDHTVSVNAQGWYSERNYTFAKKKKSVKRYMVFGDSFSSGIVVPTTWPDLLQRELQKAGNDSVELYNFSVDGSGIQNWYNIFFKIVVPQYDFDGIIIAPTAERDGVPDFDRKFVVAQSFFDKTMLSAIDVTVQSPPAQFLFEKAVPVSSVYTNQKIETIKAHYSSKTLRLSLFYWEKPDLHFISILCGVTNGIYKMITFAKEFEAYSKPHEQYESLVKQPYKMSFFMQRYKYAHMLRKMLDYANANKKEVVFVGVPDYENAIGYVKGESCIYRNELDFLAHYYRAHYFDGYSMFEGKTVAFVDSCYYKYDKHWNNKGVASFVNRMADCKRKSGL